MASAWTANQKRFMQRALEVAELGRGKVSPNPLVGCVLVKNDKIIAEGGTTISGVYMQSRWLFTTPKRTVILQTAPPLMLR